MDPGDVLDKIEEIKSKFVSSFKKKEMQMRIALYTVMASIVIFTITFTLVAWFAPLSFQWMGSIKS